MLHRFSPALALVLVPLVGCGGQDAPAPKTAEEVDLAPKPDPKKLALDREIAENAGILGALNQEGGGAFADVLGSSAFGACDDDGDDGCNALGGLIGAPAGDSYGMGGLGLSGTGRGGGGTGEGTIGIGSLGTFGRGAGSGTGQGFGSGSGGLGPRTDGPRVTTEAHDVRGTLPKDVIRRVVQSALPRYKQCYEKELQRTPELAGKSIVTFTIAPDGSVAAVKAEGDLASEAVHRCVEATTKALSFPKPDGGGVVVVKYPFTFAPVQSKPAPEPAQPNQPAEGKPAGEKPAPKPPAKP